MFAGEKLSPSVVTYPVCHDRHMTANFDHPLGGRKPINRYKSYVRCPRAMRANNVHEDLRDALQVGCGRGSDVWLVVRYFLADDSLMNYLLENIE